jgi:metal-responsive CopG/Arc/MetJ family transcriptional regulator
MAIKKVPDNPAKDLKFTKGDKEVFSVRLPEELIKAVNSAAKEQGWAKSEFVQMVLDQYLVHTGNNNRT